MNYVRKIKAFKSVIIATIISWLIFILVSGCVGVPMDEFLDSLFGFVDGGTEYLGDGVWEEWKQFDDGEHQTRTGGRDKYGRWHGPVVTERNDYDEFPTRTTICSVNYVNGKEDGEAIYTDGDGRFMFRFCYDMGRFIDCDDKERHHKTVSSSYQELATTYPDLIVALYTYGFDSTYIEAFIDTIDLMLAEYTLNIENFDDCYDTIIDSLETTHYDSIIVKNTMLSGIYGMDKLKESEFRMAVIDYYHAQGSIYDNLINSYPDYVQILYDGGVTNYEIDTFCNDLTDSLNSYPPISTSDSYFIDSVDSYIYRAVSNMWASDDDEKINQTHAIKSASSDVAGIVAFQMYYVLLGEDKIEECVKKAHFPNATVELNHNEGSSNSVGHIFVYPNPVSDILRLGFSLKVPAKVQLRILNMQGGMMHSEYLEGNQSGNYQVSIDLSGYKKGMYICSVLVDNQLLTSKKILVTD